MIHDWKEYYETMPPYAVCRDCGTHRQFNEMLAKTVYSFVRDGVPFHITGVPQCRKSVAKVFRTKEQS